MTRSNLLGSGILFLVAVIAIGTDARADETNLNLFAQDAKWRFDKNTGDGSFELASDGELPVGVLNYDFSKSKEAKSGKYVLATAMTKVEEGAQEIRIDVRTSRSQRLTFRVVDDTDQTLQYKTTVTDSGGWETIKIPLTRKLEHWGGANDGQVHFPIKRLTLSVPAPSEDPKSGKVEYANAVAVTK